MLWTTKIKCPNGVLRQANIRKKSLLKVSTSKNTRYGDDTTKKTSKISTAKDCLNILFSTSKIFRTKKKIKPKTKMKIKNFGAKKLVKK